MAILVRCSMFELWTDKGYRVKSVVLYYVSDTGQRRVLVWLWVGPSVVRAAVPLSMLECLPC